jgi:thiol-disulfide isomerase/thioredoxin
MSSLFALAATCAAAEPQEGSQAPLVRADLIGGGTFDSARERGKVIVVNFWATWCKPCREEMPALDKLYRSYRSRGLEVIAITVESAGELERINAFMKDFNFPAALAANADTRGYGKPWRIPITFVIDRHGILRFDGRKAAKALDLSALNKIVLPLLGPSRETRIAGSGAGR